MGKFMGFDKKKNGIEVEKNHQNAPIFLVIWRVFVISSIFFTFADNQS